jgi:hypothetical protein
MMNTLAGLPVELLLWITDFLPLSDRISISLCNRRLFVMLNHQTNPLSYQEKPNCAFYADWNEIYRNTSFATFAMFFTSMMVQNALVYLA